MSQRPLTQRLKNFSQTVLSDEWAELSRHEFDYQHSDGRWERQVREVYDRGDAIAVLPFDRMRGTVLLLRQFRLPAFLNGEERPLIEACAGVIDEDDAKACVQREALEELGYRLNRISLACRAYSSPGSVNECVWCFTADYTAADKVSEGGGEVSEGEDIEVLEMSLEDAVALIASGEITDMKTILLLQHLRLSLISDD